MMQKYWFETAAQCAVRVANREALDAPVFDHRGKDPDKERLVTLKDLHKGLRHGFKDLPTEQVGIYFLIEQRRVMYVGQSNDIGRRLAAHRVFDSDFAYVYADLAHLNTLEKRYVVEFWPPFNRRLKLLGHPKFDWWHLNCEKCNLVFIGAPDEVTPCPACDHPMLFP